MRLCAFLLAVATALPLLSEDAAERFSDRGCGVRFSYPRGWEVRTTSDSVWAREFPDGATRCSIHLRPAGESPVTVTIVHRPFLEVANRVGFNRISDFGDERPASLLDYPESDWAIAVRQGSAHAEQFRTRCCQAVLGETWGHGVTSADTTETVTATLAVVNDRKGHSAIVEGGSPARVSRIARSIEFRP